MLDESTNATNWSKKYVAFDRVYRGTDNEIALFIQIGGFLGLFPTLAVVLITAIAGTYLVRAQGLSSSITIQSRFREMNDPSEPLAHGAMILFSGALLLTPGFLQILLDFYC